MDVQLSFSTQDVCKTHLSMLFELPVVRIDETNAKKTQDPAQREIKSVELYIP